MIATRETLARLTKRAHEIEEHLKKYPGSWKEAAQHARDIWFVAAMLPMIADLSPDAPASTSSAFHATLARAVTAEADAARMRDALQARGWNPIATAPKDGRPLDLFMNGKRWTDFRFERGAWFRSEGYPAIERRLVGTPTHWMEPPADPEAQTHPLAASAVQGREGRDPKIEEAEANVIEAACEHAHSGSPDEHIVEAVNAYFRACGEDEMVVNLVAAPTTSGEAD